MTQPLDVVVAGELYVDLLFGGLSEWPALGQEVFAGRFRREIGGGTAITACGLAKLGTRTGVLGVAGTDFGDWLRRELASRGVDTAGLTLDDEEPTGITVAATTPDDRAFLTYAGANGKLPALLSEVDALPTCRHLHLACTPTAELLRKLRERSEVTLSLDAGWQPHWLNDPAVRTILKDVDLFFPNELEARHMTGEADPARLLDSLRQEGFRRVALKLGAAGAALLWDKEITFLPAPKVNPVDTTGAGDCFDAGFLHAWLAGEPPQECLRVANLCGALSTEAYGGIAAFPAPERICAK